MLDLPLELIVNILIFAKNPRCKLVCKLLKYIYGENIYKIDDILFRELVYQKKFYDLPAHVLDKSKTFLHDLYSSTNNINLILVGKRRSGMSGETFYRDYSLIFKSLVPKCKDKKKFLGQKEAQLQHPNESTLESEEKCVVEKLILDNYLETIIIFIRIFGYNRRTYLFKYALKCCAYYNKYDMFMSILNISYYSFSKSNDSHYLIKCFVKHKNIDAINHIMTLDFIKPDLFKYIVKYKLPDSFDKIGIQGIYYYIDISIKYNNLHAFEKLINRLPLTIFANEEYTYLCNKMSYGKYISDITKQYHQFYLAYLKHILKSTNIIIKDDSVQYKKPVGDFITLLTLKQCLNIDFKIEKQINEIIDLEISHCFNCNLKKAYFPKQKKHYPKIKEKIYHKTNTTPKIIIIS